MTLIDMAWDIHFINVSLFSLISSQMAGISWWDYHMNLACSQDIPSFLLHTVVMVLVRAWFGPLKAFGTHGILWYLVCLAVAYQQDSFLEKLAGTAITHITSGVATAE